MSKEELINAIRDINEQLDRNQKAYEPYVGRRFDSFSAEEAESIRKLMIVSQELIYVRLDLRNKAMREYGIFVF